MGNMIKLTESDLHKVIKESVNKVLTELDWKTYMNAARKRKQQADDRRVALHKEFPNSMSSIRRNNLDDMSDELEKHAEKSFQKKHGKLGHSHWYENDTPEFKGRYSLGFMANDDEFDTKAPTEDGYWDGEKADGIRHYRYGNGFPKRNFGTIHDDTFDYAYGDGWTGDKQSHRTDKIDKDGMHFEREMSTNPDTFVTSRQKDYNDALNDMADDMQDYYSGKSKYTKGKGWNK